jgi:hypothetical protein
MKGLKMLYHLHRLCNMEEDERMIMHGDMNGAGEKMVKVLF